MQKENKEINTERFSIKIHPIIEILLGVVSKSVGLLITHLTNLKGLGGYKYLTCFFLLIKINKSF